MNTNERTTGLKVSSVGFIWKVGPTYKPVYISVYICYTMVGPWPGYQIDLKYLAVTLVNYTRNDEEDEHHDIDLNTTGSAL